MKIDILFLVLLQGYVVIDNVSINGRGPYRFLIDTGSQSTTIDASVAQELSLKPTYRVSLTTPAGSRLVSATMVRNLAAGSVSSEEVEVLWYDLRTQRMVAGDIQGILGNNFLSRFDYLFDFRNRALRIHQPSGFAKSVKGERIPFRLEEGRVVVPVRFTPDGEHYDFVLDSGASSMILPPGLASPPESQSSARLQTATGEEEVALTTVPTLFVGSAVFRNVPAAIQRTALLPVRLFDAIYVNSAEGYVVVNPKF